MVVLPITATGAPDVARRHRVLHEIQQNAPTPGEHIYSGYPSGYLRETVALGRFAVHSDSVSDSGSRRYYWCTRHHRVETDADVCAARHVLGPYASAGDAQRALEQVRERNEAWDAEDARWAGEES